jgi:hypothetical protein
MVTRRLRPLPAGIESVFEKRESGVKGDRIEIVIDLGDGATRWGLVGVSEVTRNGTPVRTARFMASRIVALVEHPAADTAGKDSIGKDSIGKNIAARDIAG